MNLKLRDVTDVLISDKWASKNDGEILSRLARDGKVRRGELRNEADHIGSTGALPSDAARRSAMAEIRRYLADTASGIEKRFADLHPDLAKRLEAEGVHTADALLARATTPAQRQALALKLHVDEKDVRELAKQADLMRVQGIGPVLARSLLRAGVDSVPELAQRNPANLRDKLKSEAAAMPFVGASKLPSTAQLTQFRDRAQALPKVVVFGQLDAGFSSVPLADRVDLLLDGAVGNTTYFEGTLESFFAGHGIAVPAGYAALREEIISEGLGYLGLDDVAEVDEHSEASLSTEPEIEVVTNAQGDLLGALLRFTAYDGIESETRTLVYDQPAGEFTALYYSESANGDTHLSLLPD